MKKSILLLALALMVNTVYAQKREMNTARNYLNTYLNYDKVVNTETGDIDKEKTKTVSIEKAQEAVDKAVSLAEAQIANNDPKMKPTTAAKIYHYQGEIYMELASLGGDNAAEASDKATTAYLKALQADSKQNTEKNMKMVDFVRVNAFNSGVEAYNAQDYDKAYADFIKSKQLNKDLREVNPKMPIDTLVMELVASAAYSTGKKEEAATLYSELIDMDYPKENVYVTLMNIYNETEQKDKATEILEKGKKRFPESNQFLLNEINSLIAAEKKDEAIAKMEKATEVYAEDKVLLSNLFTNLGVLYEGMGKEKEAVANYEKAIAADPNYLDGHYSLGAYYVNKANVVIEEMNKLPFGDAKYKTMETEYLGLFDKAIPHLEDALKIDNNQLAVLQALVDIYLKKGDMDKHKTYKTQLQSVKK